VSPGQTVDIQAYEGDADREMVTITRSGEPARGERVGRRARRRHKRGRHQ
jgi:hypothetical protein